MIFISAPAGCGKTVSALLWMKKSNRRPVWIGLDTYDNSVSIFYRMFCAGILSAQPDNNRMTEILQTSAFSSAPVEYTIMLLSEFISDKSEYILALDDFHTITNQEILKSLPLILRRLPHSFITLILSRNEPDAYLSEYVKDRQAAVIGMDDLVFSAEEIKKHFGTRGRGMTAEEAEAAQDFTGGWPVAVDIISYNEVPVSQWIGGGLLVTDIKKLVWNEWDETIRTFTIASAVLDDIPVSLCEKITGRADAGIILERLRTQNIFVTRIEDDVYRYHGLFLDFLRVQTKYIEMDKKESWRIAAEYYADKEDYFVSRHYSHRSGNIKTILDIMNRCIKFNNIPIYEYVSNLQNLVYAEFAEELCEEYPVLYGSIIYMYFSIGDAQNFEMYMDKFKRHFSEIVVNHPKLAEPLTNVLLFDYRIAYAELLEKIVALPSDVFQDNEIRQVVFNMQLPYIHRGRKDLYELTDKKTYDKFVHVNDRIHKNSNEQILHAINAGLYLERNCINKALTEAQTAVGKLTPNTPKEICFSVYTHLAAGYLALNKETEFAELLEKIETFINEEAEFLRPNFLAFTSRVELWNGETADAQEWLDHYFVNESVMIEPYKLYQHFTTIRAFAVLGKLEKAKALAIRVRKMGRDFNRPQDAAEAGVLLAACLWADGGITGDNGNRTVGDAAVFVYTFDCRRGRRSFTDIEKDA